MALYSVWDWNKNAYRVYQTPGATSVGDDPKSPVPAGLHHLGADPDTQVNVLPRGARFMSYSHIARGEIRRMPGGLGQAPAPEDSPWWQRPIVMFGAGVFATFWVAELYAEYGVRRRVRANRRRRAR